MIELVNRSEDDGRAQKGPKPMKAIAVLSFCSLLAATALLLVTGVASLFPITIAQPSIESAEPPFRVFAVEHRNRYILGYFIRNPKADKCLFVTLGEGAHAVEVSPSFCYGF